MNASARIICDLCPRHCPLTPGQTGFCKVRANREDKIVSTVYGRVSGTAVDPVEKKPLYHFYPGTPIFSVGTLGCNMACDFCQNAAISKSGDVVRLTRPMSPETIAEEAVAQQCPGVALTYNEPVVWAEYAVDIAQACRQRGLKTAVVTAGFIAPEKRAWFFGAMDAANIDLKGFSDDFYRRELGADLESIKETLRFVARETDCWLEVTTLLIPTLNDDESDLRRMGDWMYKNLGAETPLHLTAFRPAHERRDLPATPTRTLFQAREWMRESGLRNVYVGNIDDPAGQSTACPQCGQTVVQRHGFRIEDYRIDDEGCCRFCGQTIAGRFETDEAKLPVFG